MKMVVWENGFIGHVKIRLPTKDASHFLQKVMYKSPYFNVQKKELVNK